MDGNDINIIAAKIADKISYQPRWLKLSAAAKYASINVKKLKILAKNGDITGYQDPDSKRADWIFDKESIDKYRLKPVREFELKINRIINSRLDV
jgi:hypothetical protein